MEQRLLPWNMSSIQEHDCSKLNVLIENEFMNTHLLSRCNLIHVTKMTYWCFEWCHDMMLHLMTNCVTGMQTHLATIMSYTPGLWRVYPAAQDQGVSAFKLELELIQYKIDFNVWWMSYDSGEQAWMQDCLVTCLFCLSDISLLEHFHVLSEAPHYSIYSTEQRCYHNTCNVQVITCSTSSFLLITPFQPTPSIIWIAKQFRY